MIDPCAGYRMMRPPSAHSTWPVIAEVLVNPQGGRQIARVTLKRGEADPATRKLLGEVAVDSGQLVMIERTTYQQFWMHDAPDRTSDSLAAVLRDKPSCERPLDRGGANVVAVRSDESTIRTPNPCSADACRAGADPVAAPRSRHNKAGSYGSRPCD